MKVDILRYCSLYEAVRLQIRCRCGTVTSFVGSRERLAGKADATHERGTHSTDVMQA